MSIEKEIKTELEKSPILANILNSLPSMIILFDKSGKEIFLNNAFKRFFEEAEQFENINEETHKIELSKDIGYVKELVLDSGGRKFPVNGCIVKAISDKVIRRNREGVLNVTVDGEKRELNVLMNILPFDFENEEYVIVTIRNIEKLKNYEKQRMEYMEKLSSIGAMASTIVHDLRNPLTGIMGYLALLKRRDSNIKNESFFEGIERSINKMNYMLEDILSLASGDLEISLNLEEVNLKSFLENFLNEYKYRHKIILDVEDDVYIRADKFRLYNIFWNLIKNADEATVSQDEKIRVYAAKDEDRVSVFVEDHGRGIPEDFKKDIFSIGKTRGKQNGRGFGLVSVKKIVEAHGGKISFESSEGVGTTFKIEFLKDKKG
jgi:signal transduction histidine kinase